MTIHGLTKAHFMIAITDDDSTPDSLVIFNKFESEKTPELHLCKKNLRTSRVGLNTSRV